MPREVKLYPLTSPQQMLFLSQKYSYKKSIVDICTMLHFEAEIDQNLMLQAINLAMLRNKSASIRLRKEGKAIKQYFSDKDSEPIIVMDYTGKEEKELEADIDLWSRTPFPNNSMDTQLYSVRLIKKPDGFYAVYYCVSHLAFDAYALMATASDMLDIYVALRDQLPIAPSKADPIKCFQDEWDYHKTEKYQKEIAFWRDEVFAEEPQYTSINGLNCSHHIKNKKYGVTLKLWQISARHENHRIPATLVNRVNDLAKSLRVSPQCLYLLALRSYLSKENGSVEDVTIFNTVARRATLLQKKVGGTRVQGIPFRMKFSNSITIEEACEEMYSLQIKYYSHSNIGATEILNEISKKHNVPDCRGYHTMSVTYQPYFVAGKSGIPFHLTTYSTGANTMPVYLTIMALDKSGDLNCNYDYIIKFVRDGVPKAIHEHLLKSLEAMCDNPKIKLDDLNRL